MNSKSGEYVTKGDYHIALDPDWPYLPVYIAKLEVIHKVMRTVSKEAHILDLGCGEGVLVNELRQQGYAAWGLDLNYASEAVQRGNLLETGFPMASQDVVLCLDVLEHLSVEQQAPAITEIARILKPGGRLILSVPNLAHFASRLSFLLRGKLLRTSSIDRHPGDRPAGEFIGLLKSDFKIEKRVGLFPTFPLISALTLWKPKAALPMHRFYNAVFGYPNWCFLNIILGVRK
ncbi:MAG: class I SAM-dependent methyltransferase [Anaerolineae bacterium]|nr:class I SAM-dependent methyltransferase [Anaerolineae bacterium]